MQLAPISPALAPLPPVRQITIRLVDQFGSTVAHPVCPMAQKFAELVGTKTLTERSLRLIQDLGFAIEIDARPTLSAARRFGR